MYLRTQGRREDAYARVVAIAHDMKSPDQSFTSYVQECGGLEEVRRVPVKNQLTCPKTTSKSWPLRAC